ncbi:MAG: AbrB family transcriptional regulator [Hyphomicrobiales bacterium]
MAAANDLPVVLRTYALAVAAGFAASRTGMPLPWMLGPFFCISFLSVAGVTARVIPMGRELAQVAIGLAIGIRFTLPMLVATASLVPAMILSTLYIMAFTLVAAYLFKAIAKVDSVTAFFATAAGGVADMAHVSERFGGEPSSVAIVHAMRVSCVVAIVPLAVTLFAQPGDAVFNTATGAGTYWTLTAGMIFAWFVALALKPTPLPNPWLVGPIFAGLLIGLTGIFEISVPAPVIVLAQIMLGTWLGALFKREMIAKLPRVSAAAVAIALFMLFCAAAGSLVLSAATDLPYSTSFLSLAPAAITEMVLTAKLMHLDAEIVSAFHIVRIAIISSTILLVFRFYSHITGGPNGPRI